MKGGEQAAKEIAARLKQARESAGLTQQEVADLLSMNRVSVTNMEGGRRNCYAHELRQLCIAYRVSADWLLGFKGPKDLPEGADFS